jgi:prepilin peptidase CpaA
MPLTLVATLLIAVFPIIVTVAACYDVLTMQIPNRFPAVLAVAFVAAALLTGLPFAAVGIHLLVGFGVLAATFALFAFGLLGGGDAKLAAAIALWFGLDQTLPFLVYMALFGGALSLVILAFRAVPLPGFLLTQDWATRLHEKGGGVPYGVALAAAALMVFPQTAWFGLFAQGL